MLASSIKSVKIPLEINLSSIMMSNGVKYIADAIENNNTDLNINLSNTSMKDEEVKILSNSLKERTCGLVINLSNNNIGSTGAKYLMQAIGESKADFLNINLRGNEINDESMEILSDSLCRTNALVHIDLSDNEITDKGAKYLTQAIEAKQKLFSIDLRNNYIDIDTENNLCKASEGTLAVMIFEDIEPEDPIIPDYRSFDHQLWRINRKINLANKEIKNLKTFKSQLDKKLSSIFIQALKAFDQWQKLVTTEGVRKAELAVNKDPTILNKLQGDTKLLGLTADEKRKQAKDSSMNLGTDLRRFTEGNTKISELKKQIKNLKQDGLSRNLSDTIVEKATLDSTGNKEPYYEIAKNKIKNLVFESQYKEYYFANNERPDHKSLFEMENIYNKIEGYINKNPALLKERTTKELVTCARFEKEIYSKNYKQMTADKRAKKPVLDISDTLKINLSAKSLTNFQTQELLKNPSSQRKAIVKGQKLFAKLNQSANILNKNLIQENPNLKEYKDLLNHHIKDFIIENNKIPTKNQQQLITKHGIHLDIAEVKLTQQRLENYCDKSLLNTELINKHKKDIAEYITCNLKMLSPIEIKNEIQLIIEKAIKEQAKKSQINNIQNLEHETKNKILKEPNYKEFDSQIMAIKAKLDIASKEIAKIKIFKSELNNKLHNIFVHPSDAFNRWQKLVIQDGIRKTESAVNKNPKILNELQGTTKLFGLSNDEKRKQAKDLSINIGTDLKRFVKSDRKISALENKIEKIKQDEMSSNLSDAITEKTTLDKTGNKILNQEIDKNKVRNLILESQYKEYRLNNHKKPPKAILRDMQIIYKKVESYITKNPNLLKKRTSKELVTCARFERDIYNENRQQMRITKIGEKPILDVSDILKINSDAKLLSDLQTQEFLKNPTNEITAIEKGQASFEKLNRSLNILSKNLIQKHPDLQEYQNLLNQNMKDFVVEHNKIPNETEQNSIIHSTHSDMKEVAHIQQHLEDHLSKSLLNSKFVKEHKKDIAEYILSDTRSSSRQQNPLQISISKELTKEIQSTLKEVIKEQKNDLALQKDLGKGLSL